MERKSLAERKSHIFEIEDAEAQLLFRLSDGELAKRYVKELSDWASTILSEWKATK